MIAEVVESKNWTERDSNIRPYTKKHFRNMKAAASPASMPYLFASRQRLNGGKQRLFMHNNLPVKQHSLQVQEPGSQAALGIWSPWLSCLIQVQNLPHTVRWDARLKKKNNNANSTDIWLHKNLSQVQCRESIHKILYFSVWSPVLLGKKNLKQMQNKSEIISTTFCTYI